MEWHTNSQEGGGRKPNLIVKRTLYARIFLCFKEYSKHIF